MKKKYTLLYAHVCAPEKKPPPKSSDSDRGMYLNITIYFKPKL